MAQHSEKTNTEAEGAPVSKRDRILGFVDTKAEIVVVDEWGGEAIEIRGMTGKARARFLRDVVDGDGDDTEVNLERFYPALLIATVYDPDTGQPLFREGDEELINSRASTVLDRLGKIAQHLSGMDKEAEKELGKP